MQANNCVSLKVAIGTWIKKYNSMKKIKIILVAITIAILMFTLGCGRSTSNSLSIPNAPRALIAARGAFDDVGEFIDELENDGWEYDSIYVRILFWWSSDRNVIRLMRFATIDGSSNFELANLRWAEAIVMYGLSSNSLAHRDYEDISSIVREGNHIAMFWSLMFDENVAMPNGALFNHAIVAPRGTSRQVGTWVSMWAWFGFP